MARKKTEKTTISFERPELVKKLVGDIAFKENKSLSAVIEKMILNTLLPENKDARWIAENYLYAKDNGIGNALSVLFANNAAGINMGIVHDNFLPVVKFACNRQQFCKASLTGKEEELYHTRSQIQSVIGRLRIRAEQEAEAGDKEKECYYKREADWGDMLLDELNTVPQRSRLVHFYQLLLNSWEDFKNWSITYRLLHDLVDLEKGWGDDPLDRMELLRILKEISKEWEE